MKKKTFNYDFVDLVEGNNFYKNLSSDDFMYGVCNSSVSQKTTVMSLLNKDGLLERVFWIT